MKKMTFALSSCILIFLLLVLSCKKDAISTEESVSDVEGNIYKTVKIGNQLWMAENLRSTLYNDSTKIPCIIKNNDWPLQKNGAYCWYNNDTNNKGDYGALYNYYAVKTNKLCPTGWSVPTTEEWNTLKAYLGGRPAGAELKEEGFSHWEYPNLGATNSTGFSGLPGGWRNFDYGVFQYKGRFGYHWSSTSSINAEANAGDLFELNSGNSDLDFNTGGAITHGFSVRCIKNLNLTKR
jgi:uncharacterized protein (TIGR02145 family)